MARPKTVRDGTKLNLYVPRSVKRHLGKLAFHQRKSISALVTDWGMALMQSAGDAASAQKEAA
jgi:hypothetical protein